MMAKTFDNSKVEVNEVTKVTPVSDSDSTIKTTPFILPLTYFDSTWFKFPPVERLFFYEFPDLTSDSFNSLILPKLKRSLSLTLLHYLPLAGNIMWPPQDAAAKPAIYYFPNDGVSVTVALSNTADFGLLSGNGIRDAVEFHPLVPQLSISEDKAEVISIQVTLFPKQGFSIGVSSHHAVLDGKSSTMFFKSWAYLCKQEQNPGLLSDQLIPWFDRTVIKDPKGLDMAYVKVWMDFTRSDSDPNPRSLNVLPVNKASVNSNLVRMTFELSREDIKKLKNKVEININKQLHLSSFVVTCAHLFVCLAKAKKVEANTTVKFAIAADCRSRLDPPIPDNYFGNCVGGEFVTVKARDLIMEETAGFAFAAEKLSDYIKGFNEGVIEGSEDKLAKILAEMKETGLVRMSVAGSNRFDVYGSDFGWGRPKKVEIVSIDRTGAISLAESRDGSGGFEIGVVMENKQQMGVFASLFANGLKDL